MAILKITFIAALFLAVSALALRWGYRALSKHESARLVTMAEIVDSVEFLLNNTGINGVNLAVDGGWLLK